MIERERAAAMGNANGTNTVDGITPASSETDQVSSTTSIVVQTSDVVVVANTVEETSVDGARQESKQSNTGWY